MDDQLEATLILLGEAFEEYRDSLFVQRALGDPISRIPPVCETEAKRRAALGKRLLHAIRSLDASRMPDALRGAIAVAERLAVGWERESDWYWLVFDPRSLGHFSLFTATSYGCGALLNGLHDSFNAFPIERDGDEDRYLGLIEDYGALIRQLRERTEGQYARQIAMPREQTLQALSIMAKMRDQAVLALEHSRSSSASATFKQAVAHRVERAVLPAYEHYLSDLKGKFLDQSVGNVGMAQYPGGLEVYRELVKLQTTIDISPEEVHALGLERMSRIRTQMDEICRSRNVDGGPHAFLSRASKSDRWCKSTGDGVRNAFEEYIERIKPGLSEWFYKLPSSGHGVQPLSPALEENMTFGYYRRPTPADNQGIYYFNQRNMVGQPLLHLAALTYHELQPGHHLQMAGLMEDKAQHPLVAHSFINAYVEGWAEYAAELAAELGMYREPEERFGKLIMDAFLTSRLVVDTGMNALNWSLEKAREYMRDHAFIAEKEILSETLRYSCDIPAQSLAYKIGDLKFAEMRDGMASALGPKFDVRDFHEVVLAHGALPLSMVAENVRRATLSIAQR